MSVKYNDLTRTFLAIAFHPTFSRDVEHIQHTLTPIVDHAKWVNPQAIHLTLHFFGDLRPDQIRDVSDALRPVVSAFNPFTLSLKDIGVFPHLRRPRIIWVGMTGEVSCLRRLKLAIDEVLKAKGFNVERRDFVPHLTVARLKETRFHEPLAQQLEHTSFESRSTMTVERVTLFSSTLTPRGAVYAELDNLMFAGASDDVQA